MVGLLPPTGSNAPGTATKKKKTHSVFLYGDISEMHKEIVQFADAGVILHSAKPTETQPVPGARYKIHLKNFYKRIDFNISHSTCNHS